MSKTIKKAVILAAGFGKRMLPLTSECPKPLLKVGGKPIIDWILDDLKSVGVEEVVVNTHYLAERISNHLKDRTDIKIHISYEDEILETAGGVKNVLQVFNNKPFYVINGDVIWRGGFALQDLANMWGSTKMKLLLMLYPQNKLPKCTDLEGDYSIKADGQISHKQGADYIFAGPRIVDPELFQNTPDGAFSFLELFNKAEKNSELYGYIHKGEWYHIGNPAELEHVNDVF